MANRTVGELIRALSAYPTDLAIGVDGSDAVTVLHYAPHHDVPEHVDLQAADWDDD